MLLRIAFISLLAISYFAQTTPAKIATLSSGIGSSTYLQSIGQSSVVTGASVAGGYNIRQVALYSMDGLRVWTGEIAANLSDIQLLDLDRLHTRKYILRLVSGNQVITKQLIKD